MKILFYAINGKGMGHLARTRVVARALEKAEPGLDIRFVTGTPHMNLLKEIGYPVIRIPNTSPAKNLILYKKGSAVPETRVLQNTVRYFKPQAIIYDFLLNYSLFKYVHEIESKNLVIFRKQRKSRLKKLLTSDAAQGVDKWIIPHEPCECEEILDFINPNSCLFTGGLSREIDNSQVENLKAKLEPGKKRVVVTIGGGGAAEAQKWLIEVLKAAKMLIYEKQAIHFVVVYGPYFRGDLTPFQNIPGIDLVAFEPELAEHFCVADLVICNAGYNTVNEIRMTGAPAMVYPLSSTGWDDQKRRAENLSQSEQCIICPAQSDLIAKKIEEILTFSLINTTKRYSQQHHHEKLVEIGGEILNEVKRGRTKGC